MTHRNSVTVAAVATMLAVGSGAPAKPTGASGGYHPPQVIPKNKFVVINGTSSALTCQSSLGTAAWSAPFTLAGGGEWDKFGSSGGPAYRFRCNPPVERTIYTLAGGQRNVLLRDSAKSPIRLRVVNA